VKGLRPGFVRSAVEDLLPDFARVLDPLYQEAVGKPEAVAPYFQRNPDRVAEALLSITDARAKRIETGLVKKTYEKLRPMAKKNVEAAAPRLGKLVEKHTSTT